MKYLIGLMVLTLYGRLHAQSDANLNEKAMDTLRYRSDPVRLHPQEDSLPPFDPSTPNVLLFRQKNYESINNSVLTGAGFSFIRAKSDPLITVDGIPANPIVFTPIPYKGFVGSPHFLSYDIQSASIDPFTDQSQKIVSGQYNGSLAFKTRSISRADTAGSFFVNNFSSVDFQTSDKLGYSVVTNAGIQRAHEHLSYRLSLVNGYHNGFISHYGLKRNGGNIKIIVNPLYNTAVTGFLDYSTFSDFKRQNDDQFHGKRIFTYIDVNSQLNKTFSLQAKGSLNIIDDNVDKQTIKEIIRHDGQVLSPERYTYHTTYKRRSEYVDVRMRIQALEKKALNAWIYLGVSHQRTKEPYSIFEEYRIMSENGSYTAKTYSSRAELNDDKIYGKINIRADLFSLNYLADISRYRLSAINGGEGQGVNFGNHFVDIAFPILNKQNGIINKLSIQGKGARTNSVFMGPKLPHHINTPATWVNANTGYNYEPSVSGVFFGNRINLDIGYYYGVNNDYDSKHYSEDWSDFPVLIELGKLHRYALEVNTMISVLKNEDLEWTLKAAYSMNRIQWTHDHAWVNDTNYSNSIVTAETALHYRNLRFIVSGESKRNFDFYYYRQYVINYHPPAGDPFSPEQTHETTSYLILKNIELQYRILPKDRLVDEVTVAITFNKIRNLFAFDAENIYDVHKPFFYNTLGISTSIRI